MGHGARHADGAAAHGDGDVSIIRGMGDARRFIIVIQAHIRNLAAAIHAVEDVATRDDYLGVAPHLARELVPVGLIFALGVFLHIGEPSRAAAKHVAEPRLAVGRDDALLQRHGVEGVVVDFTSIFIAILPVVGGVKASGYRCCCRINELTITVQLINDIAIFINFVARADLSAADGHLGVASHMAGFGAAKHGGFHPAAAHFHLGVVHCGQEVEEAGFRAI